MKVPLLDLSGQHDPLKGELMAAFEGVLQSGRFILGEEVEAFEKEVAAVVGAEFAVGVSSGTDALLVALMALEIGPGDEVICPSFTFFATAGCVARLGAKPVFVDSCPSCFNLDGAAIEELITPRTRAVIPVHLFGQAAAMDPVMDVAKRHNLAVVEDTAQSLGGGLGGRSLGTIGDVGIYSFFPTKNLGGFGDGGMMVMRDGDLAERARVLRNHGMKPKYHHEFIGGNFRLDALQAALLRVKLPHLGEYGDARTKNASDYTEGLGRIEGVAKQAASGCGEGVIPDAKVILPMVHEGNDANWNQYTIRVRGEGRRDALVEHLGARGIGCEIYYPIPLHRQACFGAGAGRSLPVCEAAASEVLSLPIFPGLTDEMKTAVIEAVGAFLAER